MAGARGGTGLVWGNTANLSAGGLNNFFTLTTYRVSGSLGGWGACDGSSPYDANDGTAYYSGTVSSYNSGTTTITVSDTPNWANNQWSPNGAPYSVHDVTQNNGSEITANGSNTLTILESGGPGTWTPNSGDSIQILRATYCIDQAGGRGTASTLYNATDPATSASSANEVLSPTYIWSNSFIGGTPNFNTGTSGVGSYTARIIRSRDFYVENTNQGVQSNSTTPFDGTANVGIGHGTLANRPAACTTGVGYFATDQGSWNTSGSGGQGVLYICGAGGWPSSPSYTPYTYPHHLVSGNAGGGGNPPNPPTSLLATVQ